MATKITIEVDEKTLRQLVAAHFEKYGISPDDVVIEVKSQQNYKSEWERAAFRARAEVGR